MAILAGAIAAPFFVILLAMLASDGPNGIGAKDFVPMLLGLSGLGIIFGGPVALAAIVILFGPLWFLHRRFEGGPLSFVALAGVAGLLLLFVAMAMLPDEPPGDSLFWIWPLAAALSGAVMWPVAHLGRKSDVIDTRALPQANFVQPEPQ